MRHTLTNRSSVPTTRGYHPGNQIEARATMVTATMLTTMTALADDHLLREVTVGTTANPGASSRATKTGTPRTEPGKSRMTKRIARLLSAAMSAETTARHG